jgi:hypothetical protein
MKKIKIKVCDNLYLTDIPTFSIFNMFIFRYEFKYGYIALGFSICKNHIVINLLWYRILIIFRDKYNGGFI